MSSQLEIWRNQLDFLSNSLQQRKNNNQLFSNTTDQEVAWENSNHYILFISVYDGKGRRVHTTRLYPSHVVCVPPRGSIEQIEALS
jgi:hypothetical protein